MSHPALVQVGFDHRGVALPVLEAAHAARREAALRGTGAPEAAVVTLSTCHRLELYAEGVPEADAVALFTAWLGLGPGRLTVTPAVRRDEDAARHLLRVAAGLESVALGEDQILSQLRRAYREASAAGTPGPLLHRLFHAAFRAGRRVRSETTLGRGGRSLAGAAINVLERRLGGFGGRSVLVVGAGETASLAARRLHQRGASRILVTSRTTAHAAALAAAVGGEAVPWAWRSALPREVHAIVCATAATVPVLSTAVLAETARRPGGLLAVDLSVPRNLPATVPGRSPAGLVVFDVESLAATLADETLRRSEAVGAAGALVEEELDSWWTWVRSRDDRDRRAGRRAVASLAG